MPILIDQNILRLEIPVQNLLRVQILDGQQYFCKQHFGLSYSKSSIFRSVIEQLPTRAKV